MNQIFHIAPSSVRPIWFLLPILLLVIVIGTSAVILGGSVRGARSTVFELSDEGLGIRGDVYGRLIPSSEVRGTVAGVSR